MSRRQLHLLEPAPPPASVARRWPRFKTLLADPPWKEQGGGKIKRGADRHYPLMSTPEIIDCIWNCPAFRPHDDSHLYLWVTNNFFSDGLQVMAALGYRFIHPVTWGKISGNGNPYKGIGQYRAGATEHLLFGVKGKDQRPVKTGRRQMAHSTLLGGDLIVPSSTHSEKPFEQYADIEGVSPGPYVELFAREMRQPGWHYYGMLDGEDQPEVLAKLNKNGTERRFAA